MQKNKASKTVKEHSRNTNNDYSSLFQLRDPEQVYQMARKPCSFKDLQDQINKKITLAEIKVMVGVNKVIAATFGSWDGLEEADLSANQWWRIILEQEQVELLVDTQGYSYPRYAGILSGK